MNGGVKAGVIGACVVVLAAGGYGAYQLVGKGGVGGSPKPDPSATMISATPPTDPLALKQAQAFLDAWASGAAGYPKAAADTDAAATAQQALTSYSSGLGLSTIAFGKPLTAVPDPAVPNAVKVGFTVTAKVGGPTGHLWSYPDSLDVVQTNSGVTSVRWSSAVLYPKLGTGQSLKAGAVPAAPGTATVLASDGTPLTAAKYPSLTQIIPTIAGSAEGLRAVTGGSGGSGVVVTNAAGTTVSTVKVFTPATGGTITTTINASLQAVAEQAVVAPTLDGKPGSVVALDRTNGHILAIAYSGHSGNTAINAELAPGSTMKIITSAALFDDAGLNPSSPAPCTADVVADGQVFHNDSDITANPRTTIEQGFAESCNASFIKDGYDDLVHGSDATALAKEADDVFGLGNWDIGGGVETANPQVPMNPAGSNAAADLIGQGTVTMNPLVLASLAATVRDGAFHQPIILPGQPQPPAAKAMNPTTDGYLRQIMAFDANNSMGTAYPRMNQIPGSGAKTGTAEVGPTGNTTTNGWFTAYDDNISAAALVQGGTTGVGTAGYIVQSLLNADH
ncbi:penicillin-binding transpeptidase domain-containing protein [Streptacidiphilus sp. P02-A3a]|uniref:penicillin-binding transpeptidase domain-containing protein n=1 Tax=Streptacidiphilus sp. P02-A3a TaxID=2704468 RepID=UPI0015FA0D5A|nr:penicillin-binding transpeptidase domain-containing protein [Streptacidiphilus sp. P02-A3a]QMU74048.1 penicillin-binding protein [Streptacidiphilus sp. P02-A3a]